MENKYNKKIKAAENLKKKGWECEWGWRWMLEVGRMKKNDAMWSGQSSLLFDDVFFFVVQLKYTLKVIPKYFWQPQTIFHEKYWQGIAEWKIF